MRVGPAVIDTNVVVSGILTSLSASPTARILDGMIGGRFHFLLSIDLLTEYRDVLVRPRIRTRHGLPDASVDVILTEIAANGAMLDISQVDGMRARRADEHLWKLLAAAPAATLVTGDLRLIERPVRGACVISAREFVDSLER
jgi:putative PIN family toxin of toxin-antitoxin system